MAARVWLAARPVQLHEQIGGAVDDARLVVEARRGVHEAQQVDELLHAVEVAQGVLDHAERGQRRVARRLVALADIEVLPTTPGRYPRPSRIGVVPRR